MDEFFLALFGLSTVELQRRVDEAAQAIMSQVRDIWMPQLREQCFEVRPFLQEYYERVAHNQGQLFPRTFYLGSDKQRQGRLSVNVSLSMWMEFRRDHQQGWHDTVSLEVVGSFEVVIDQPELRQVLPDARLHPLTQTTAIGSAKVFATKWTKSDDAM